MSSRAYSLLHVKHFEPSGRKFSGIASSPTPDRVGDIIEPKGISAAVQIPLLLFHNSTMPVGTVRLGRATSDGVPFTAEIPEVAEPGEVKNLTDKAAHFVKYGLIRAVSIGFRALEGAVERLADGGLKFLKTEVMELSLVPIPAQVDAVISVVKSYDQDPAASGTGDGQVASTLPGDMGVISKASRKGATGMKKTYSEQIAALETKRAASDARREEIQTKAVDEGRTKDETEREEFATLCSEIAGIDAELVDLRKMEASNKAAAVVVKGATPEEAARSRSVVTQTSIRVEQTLPKGIGFARAVKARLVAKLDGRNPVEVAKEMYPSDDRLHAHLNHDLTVRNLLMQMKAAVPAATSTVSAWAGALVDPTNLAGEFIEYLRPATIIGRLNLRSIPTNVRLIEQTQGGTGYWVGQGAPKPLTAFGFAPVTLGPTKVAAIAVATEEALRFSTPSLDALIRDSLRAALVERVDRDLLDPAEAGSSNVQPASLTNGLTALTSAGTSADNVRTDIGRLVRTLRTNNLRGPIAIVLPDSLLTGLAWTVNALGQPEFPGLTGEGGTFNGIRFIGSEYMANSSGAGNMVVAIAESEVFVSDDGGVTVDASREASLQMLDNPTNNSATATPTTMVSMWQTNSVAFRGEWHINWAKRRSTAVAYMDDVNWSSVGSPA